MVQRIIISYVAAFRSLTAELYAALKILEVKSNLIDAPKAPYSRGSLHCVPYYVRLFVIRYSLHFFAVSILLGRHFYIICSAV